MLEKYDIINVLVNLLDFKPWYKVNKEGQRMVFDEHKWVPVKKNEFSKVCKLDAQCWLSI